VCFGVGNRRDQGRLNCHRASHPGEHALPTPADMIHCIPLGCWVVYRRRTSAALSHTDVSRYRGSDSRTYTFCPLQPAATVSMNSSPSSAHTIRATIGTGWWKMCSGLRAPVELRIFCPGDQALVCWRCCSARHPSTHQVSNKCSEASRGVDASSGGAEILLRPISRSEDTALWRGAGSTGSAS
jgi:hypothetical protein